MIVTKPALVEMATYKPTSKEEFISLKFLGEKAYQKCGEMFINAIKQYEEEKKDHR